MQPENTTTPTTPENEDQSGGFYRPEQQPVSAGAPTADSSVDWEASEYIHHSKGVPWVLVLMLATLVLAGVAFWLGAWTFGALIVVMGIVMGVFAFRPPRVLRYKLTDAGVRIGDKFYNYADFKAFGVIQEGAFFTMLLIPTKRFMPSISLYFAEKDGEKIVNMVGSHLPMEDLHPDIIDTVMRRLRF